MSLTQSLADAKQEFIAHTPLEIQSELFRSIQEQQESGIPFGLKEGQKAKDFTLKNALGETVNLYDELSKGPVVLTFYRGGWCPFCNMQLKAYQKVLPQIEELGAQLLAISPQSPDNTLSQKEKEELTFQVLSDNNGLVAAFYNILYDVPDYLQDVMKNKMGMDLAEYNATNRWILPIPSTFMIDESGIIRSAYVNPDFMQRFDPEDILHELRKL
ncbi:peroxiredoxin-like family protein [Paenibacillus physcomitrellae]|uniref:thioredoxin-dependent peroxiredoxin n=1 Tax=Paenibacillus physcomitrellae TaxID=1619311 RepID=A0ABQ1G1Z0_9BACL|nr:peroxiredoxin-like family protein [Paenibacillus physcomitrellae]GGA33963.1 alkyl hydroperoxide reductase [Paenibacillus physcomitrellae]